MILQDLSAVAVNLAPHSLYLILSDQVLKIPPVIPMRRDLSGPPKKCPTTLRELYVYLGLSFIHWVKCRPKGALLVQHRAGLEEGKCGQCIANPLALLMQSFRVSVVGGGCFSLTPGSGISSMEMSWKLNVWTMDSC